MLLPPHPAYRHLSGLTALHTLDAQPRLGGAAGHVGAFARSPAPAVTRLLLRNINSFSSLLPAGLEVLQLDSVQVEQGLGEIDNQSWERLHGLSRLTEMHIHSGAHLPLAQLPTALQRLALSESLGSPAPHPYAFTSAAPGPDDISVDLQRLSHLTRLELCRVRLDSLHHEPGHLRALTQLRDLSLRGMYLPNYVFFDLSTFSHLTRLHLKACGDDHALLATLPPSLKHLAVSFKEYTRMSSEHFDDDARGRAHQARETGYVPLLLSSDSLDLTTLPHLSHLWLAYAHLAGDVRLLDSVPVVRLHKCKVPIRRRWVKRLAPILID